MSDHEPGHNTNLIETGDDTSHEEPSVQRMQELLADKTAPMADGVRQYMQRLIKFVVWCLGLSAAQEIPETLLRLFTKRKYQKDLSDSTIEKMFTDFEVLLRCQVINHGLTWGDEYGSHVMHQASILEYHKDQLQWKNPNWYKIVGFEKFKKLDNKHKRKAVDLNQIHNDRHHWVIKTYSHPKIRAMWRIWLMQEIKRISTKIEQYMDEPAKFGKIKVSNWGFGLQFELACTISKCNLLSFEKLHKPPEEHRNLYIGKDIIQWLHKSYENMNELPYLMLYDSISEEGTLNDKLLNGIPKNLDYKISIGRFAKTSADQKGLLEHYLAGMMKILLWFPLLDVILKGSWFWTLPSIHVPLQKLSIVIKNVAWAHYFQVAKKNLVDPLSMKQRTSHEYKCANQKQMLKWKIEQVSQFWIWSICDPTKDPETIHNECFSRFCNDGFWCLPQSTGLVTACPSTVLFPCRNLGTTTFRGHTADTCKEYAAEQQTNNFIQCNQAHVDLEYYFDNNTFLTEVREIIKMVNDCTNSNFNQINQFKTYLADEVLTQKFSKSKKLKSTAQWSGDSQRRRSPYLFLGEIFYGNKWRFLDSKQWEACNRNINFKTASLVMRHASMKIVDEGMKTFGDDWDVTDTSSSNTELPSQKQHFIQCARQGKKKLRKKKNNNNHNTNDNSNSNNKANSTRKGRPRKTKQSKKAPTLDLSSSSDSSDTNVMTEMTKYEDSGSESENSPLHKNNPKSMNSQNLDTVTIDNLMGSGDEGDESNNSQHDDEEQETDDSDELDDNDMQFLFDENDNNYSNTNNNKNKNKTKTKGTTKTTNNGKRKKNKHNIVTDFDTRVLRSREDAFNKIHNDGKISGKINGKNKNTNKNKNKNIRTKHLSNTNAINNTKKRKGKNGKKKATKSAKINKTVDDQRPQTNIIQTMPMKKISSPAKRGQSTDFLTTTRKKRKLSKLSNK